MTKGKPQAEPCITITVPLRWDAIWQAIMTVSDGGAAAFLPSDVAEVAELPILVVDAYLARLIKGGAIEKVTTRGAKLRVKVAHRQAPTSLWPEFQNLWNAMRAMKTFTFDELVFAATTDDVKIPTKLARDYFYRLRDHGYIVANQRPVGPDMAVIYRLVPAKNTGALAPVLVELIVPQPILFDRNTKTSCAIFAREAAL